MPTNTYTPIASVTLATGATEIILSGLPQTFRDLVLVINGTVNSTDTCGLQFNGDTGNNYNSVSMEGNGSSASSSSWTSIAQAFYGVMSTGMTSSIIQIHDYSVTDKQKTFLARTGAAGDRTRAHASRWANTAAITSIRLTTFGGVTYQTGTVVNLFGIVA